MKPRALTSRQEVQRTLAENPPVTSDARPMHEGAPHLHLLSSSEPNLPSPLGISTRLRRTYAARVNALGLRPQSLPLVVGHLLLHPALGVAAAAACMLALRHHPWLGWALYPLVAFFIGTRFRALGNMIHEASHGTLVQGKRRNRWLGHLLCIVDFTSFEAYMREHFSHHAYLGDREKDLDFQGRWKFGFGRDTGTMGPRHLLLPLLLVHLPTFVRPVLFSRKDPGSVTVGRWLFVAGLLALASWGVGWKAFLLFYLVPFLITYQVVRYWSDALDHAGCLTAKDEFFRSRNHLLGSWVLGRVMFPRNDEFHLTHHLFPSVPTGEQPRVHALLLNDPDYAAREHGLRGAL